MLSLSEDQIKHLQGLLEAPTYCRYRGCHERGEFLLRRKLRNGNEQVGLFCAEHEEQFGDENLKRWAKMIAVDAIQRSRHE